MPITTDAEILLSRLPIDGSTIGNLALRETLGWDEARYAAAKQTLAASGSLQKGQGRGGTVRRATGTPAITVATPKLDISTPKPPIQKNQTAMPATPSPIAAQRPPADQSLSALCAEETMA